MSFNNKLLRGLFVLLIAPAAWAQPSAVSTEPSCNYNAEWLLMATELLVPEHTMSGTSDDTEPCFIFGASDDAWGETSGLAAIELGANPGESLAIFWLANTAVGELDTENFEDFFIDSDGDGEIDDYDSLAFLNAMSVDTMVVSYHSIYLGGTAWEGGSADQSVLWFYIPGGWVVARMWSYQLEFPTGQEPPFDELEGQSFTSARLEPIFYVTSEASALSHAQMIAGTGPFACNAVPVKKKGGTQVATSASNLNLEEPLPLIDNGGGRLDRCWLTFQGAVHDANDDYDIAVSNCEADAASNGINVVLGLAACCGVGAGIGSAVAPGLGTLVGCLGGVDVCVVPSVVLMCAADIACMKAADKQREKDLRNAYLAYVICCTSADNCIWMK